MIQPTSPMTIQLHIDERLSSPCPSLCLVLALGAPIDELPIDDRQIFLALGKPALRLVQCEAHEQCAGLRIIRRDLPRTARGFEPAAPGQEFTLGSNPVA